MGKWIAGAAGAAFAFAFPQAFLALAISGVLYVGFCWVMERMTGKGEDVKNNGKQENGFTLVELTIVLIILGVLVGGLLVPLSSQDDQKRRGDTAKAMEDTKDAINGYLMINGRAPCPATASPGPESIDGAGKCTAQSGFVPMSLGMATTDAWNRPLRYSVARLSWNTDDTTITFDDTVTTEDALINHAVPTEKLRTNLGVCSAGDPAATVVAGSGTDAIVCTAPATLVSDKIGAAVWSDGPDATTDADNLVTWTAWPTMVMHSAKHPAP